MTTDGAPPATDPPDAELVALSRTGDRDAFAQIVARYQSLICALAYSGLGNFAQSEDLAQETFVTAWQKLSNLDEPAKLRGWLCGIARNLIQNRRRQQVCEPTHAADSLASADTLPAPELSPATLAIQRDEEAILWREIEKIPELYREPLILFYRQNQSIENVAAALDLSEDAVKQRLSRGRKLLQEQVLAFVEGTLARTNPGSAFTSNVMSALPIAAGSAIKTATLAVAAAKTATVTKASWMLGWFGLLVWPLIALLAGLYSVAEDSLNKTDSTQKKYPTEIEGRKVLIVLILGLLLLWAVSPYWETHRFQFGIGCAAVLGYIVEITVIARRSPNSGKIKLALTMGTRQAASIALFLALCFVVDHYWKSTLIFIGVTLVGLVFVKLAELGDPNHWKIAIRATGAVAFVMVCTARNTWSGHLFLFMGAILVIKIGFRIIERIILPKAVTPNSSAYEEALVALQQRVDTASALQLSSSKKMHGDGPSSKSQPMPPESDNVNSRRERIEARRLRIRARRVQSRARLKESMGRLKLLGQAYKTYYVTDWKSITWLFATACPLGIAAGAMQAFYEKTGQFGFRIGFILCLTWAALLIIRYYLHGNAHFRKIKADLGLVDPPGARFVLAGTYGVFALVTLILKFADSSRLLLCVGVIFAWLVLNSAVINIAKKRATQAGSGHPVPR